MDKTFGLKSIDDDFIPNLKPEVKKAIKDKEIRLTKGSLLKIVARGREKYIPLVKQSLEDTDMVLKDNNDFIFIKDMHDGRAVFTSIGADFDTHITIISNAPKKINNIKNKMLNGVKVVYRSSKLRTTPLIQAFTDEWSITNRIDKGIIPQIKGLEYSRGN